ncbi:MAG TPA: hypothetical protein VMJ93_13410 [Verrucomicrobiae bacterium]|nr:hypothetical protein [Verrucomicrobiae bacterium]
MRDGRDGERAWLEWMYFGLFVFVDGIQDNFPVSSNVGVGVAIARELLSQFQFHATKVMPSLTTIQQEIDERIKRYETAGAEHYERIGFAAAAAVLGLEAAPGTVPQSLEAFEFSIGANKFHIGALKAVNDFFKEYRIET